ncbi:alpha-2Db adrenergic receptor-like [Antedon mediterranea]|uniref:alpha-2Db adrenergic receptor-like n=1 Tax=Antedon mediterranea TaxID=105859 RepID=UPI003AF44787
MNSEEMFNETETSTPKDTHVVLIISLWMMALITICGNILVIVAWCFDKKINYKPANVFILNLSIADLLIGLIVMPLNILFLQYGYWATGRFACKVWLMADYISSHQGFLLIVFISLDRYWLIKKGQKYNSFQTHRRTQVMCILGWLSIIAFYSLTVFVLSEVSTNTLAIIHTYKCDWKTSQNASITVVIAIILYTPLVFLIYFNSVVYIYIKKRKSRGVHVRNSMIQKDCKVKGNQSKGLKGSMLLSSNSKKNTPTRKTSRMVDSHRPQEPITNPRKNDTIQQHDLKVESCNGTHVNTSTTNTCSQNINPLQQNGDERKSIKSETCNRNNASTSTSRMQGTHQQVRSSPNAFVMLTSLVFVFCVCWLPFTAVITLQSIYGWGWVSDLIWQIVNILLWSNSFLNPFLYASRNPHFKKHFTKLFCRLNRFNRLNVAAQ